jgi:hypothetical protein
MENETILGTIAAVLITGGIGFMFKWMFTNSVNNTKLIGKNASRIDVLESTAVTNAQLDETLDKTIVPILKKVDGFGETLEKTMDDLRDMKADQIIETRVNARYEQMLRERNSD